MPETVTEFYRFVGAGVDVPIWPIVVFVALQIIVMFKWREYKMTRDGTWHSTGVEMRRWIDGKWERRPMTEAEANDWKDVSAW